MSATLNTLPCLQAINRLPRAPKYSARTTRALIRELAERWRLSDAQIRAFTQCDQLALNQAKFNAFADDLTEDPVHVAYWKRTCVMEVDALDDWAPVAAESAKNNDVCVKKEEEPDDAALLLGRRRDTAIDLDGVSASTPVHVWRSDDECGVPESESSEPEGSEFQPEDSPESEDVDDDVRNTPRPRRTITRLSKRGRPRVYHASSGSLCVMLILVDRQCIRRSHPRFPFGLRTNWPRTTASTCVRGGQSHSRSHVPC